MFINVTERDRVTRVMVDKIVAWGSGEWTTGEQRGWIHIMDGESIYTKESVAELDRLIVEAAG